MISKMKNLTYWNICRRSTRVSADDDKSPLDPPVTPFTAGSEIQYIIILKIIINLL